MQKVINISCEKVQSIYCDFDFLLLLTSPEFSFNLYLLSLFLSSFYTFDLFITRKNLVPVNSNGMRGRGRYRLCPHSLGKINKFKVKILIFSRLTLTQARKNKNQLLLLPTIFFPYPIKIWPHPLNAPAQKKKFGPYPYKPKR